MISVFFFLTTEGVWHRVTLNILHDPEICYHKVCLHVYSRSLRLLRTSQFARQTQLFFYFAGVRMLDISVNNYQQQPGGGQSAPGGPASSGNSPRDNTSLAHNSSKEISPVDSPHSHSPPGGGQQISRHRY